ALLKVSGDSTFFIEHEDRDLHQFNIGDDGYFDVSLSLRYNVRTKEHRQAHSEKQCMARPHGAPLFGNRASCRSVISRALLASRTRATLLAQRIANCGAWLLSAPGEIAGSSAHLNFPH